MTVEDEIFQVFVNAEPALATVANASQVRITALTSMNTTWDKPWSDEIRWLHSEVQGYDKKVHRAIMLIGAAGPIHVMGTVSSTLAFQFTNGGPSRTLIVSTNSFALQNAITPSDELLHIRVGLLGMTT